MVFVETYAFTKHIPDCFDDEEYREFQSYLMKHPAKGVLIPGTGGLRKIRWAARNKGKRGGARIIYYWHIPLGQIYLLALYTKNEMTDLSSGDKKALKHLEEERSL